MTAREVKVVPMENVIEIDVGRLSRRLGQRLTAKDVIQGCEIDILIPARFIHRKKEEGRPW